LWLKAWSYKDHGKSWPQVYEKKHPPGFRWLHESFGTNYRMTEMQSAIGRLQLKMMKDWSLKRKDFAEQIWDKSRNIKGLRVPEVPNYIKHAAYKAYVFVEPDLLNEGWTRDRIIEEIVSKGVPCFSGSCSEVYLEKAFDNTDFRPIKRLSNAKLLGEVSLMFLCHPTLKKSEIDMTCEVIEDVMSMAVAQEIK
jgi:dTDP-4-amino-4,6-dideoxygalactose transaminase